MQERANLLHVIRAAEGGMKNHLFYLLNNTDTKRFNVMVACPGCGSVYERLAGERRFKVFPLNICEGLCPLSDLRAAAALAKIVRDEQINIMHTHSIKAALVGRLAGLWVRVPGLVCTMHNTFFYQGQPGWQKWLAARIEYILSRHTSKIIAVSGALKRELVELIGVDSCRVELINNGIEVKDVAVRGDKYLLRQTLDLPQDRLLIGTVARLAPQKGITHLLKAGKILKEYTLRNFLFQLIIVGDGPLRGELEDEAESLGIREQVSFVGEKDNVFDYLGAFDVFVLPSETEGLPLVLLEAMSVGLPVVATNVGGIPEVIRNNYNGLLVPPCDSFAIAHTLAEVLADQILGSALGERAALCVREEYSAGRMAERVSELYCAILESCGLVLSNHR